MQEKEQTKERKRLEEEERLKEKEQTEGEERMQERERTEGEEQMQERERMETRGQAEERKQAEGKQAGYVQADKAQVEKAMETLRDYVLALTAQAGESRERGEELWKGISRSGGLLRELAYYHDYGSFLCEYKVAGYTLADALVWQVDHFKLYMDRPEEMNRYRQQRLLLAAFETMVQMEKAPEPLMEKMRQETGQDILL